MSDFEKMMAGEWYSCLTDELETLRVRARQAVHQHNTMEPVARGMAAPLLRGLFAGMAEDAMIEAPFHCSYGFNIHLGGAVYLNAGCIILDSAPVRIGARSMLGPGVNIYCAEHHHDPVLRGQGIEIAKPVTLGEDVWIGGRAVLMPGVSVGDRAIVAAGAVVTRDVPADGKVAGVPARAI